MQTVPLNNSHDPIAWQHAADALREIGQDAPAQVCHDTAGEMMRDANAADDAVVQIVKRETSE